MTIAQLEANLRAKKTEAQTLLETTMRTAAADIVTPASGTTPAVVGRSMTDPEKAAIQALLDDAKGIKARIDRMSDDSRMTDAIARLTDGIPNAPAPTEPTRDGQPERRSLGAQFVGSEPYRDFIRRNGHRSAGQWTSPTVELSNPFVATTLDTTSGSGGALILPDVQPGILPLLFRRLVVADLLASGTTTSNVIQFMKETTFTNAAAAVAQAGVKPESALVFAAATSVVQKIAHWIPVTEEMLEDFAQTASIIDARLRFGLALTEEDQLLNGSGIAPNLLGLMNLTGLSAAQPRGTDTNMDAIFKQMTAIATTSFIVPDGFVINPTNWMTIQLSKNTLGNYMGSGPWAPAQPPTLWGVAGAVTPAIAAGVSLVGAFKTAAQVFRKGGVRVESSNSHASFFTTNLVAIRAEERLALVAYREAAFGKVTGLN